MDAREPRALKRNIRAQVRSYKRKNRSLILTGLVTIFPILLFVLSTWYGGGAQSSDVGHYDGFLPRHLLAITPPCPPNTSGHGGEEHVFPNEIFDDDQKKNGAIILYLLGAIVCFIGLYFICDLYFEPALDEISTRLGLSDDVAGATFMAAGSSAPELFTSLVGVFIAQSDVGVGTIIGSAIFNLLVIIGVVGIILARKKPKKIQSSWYVLTRDISFYSMSVVLLTASIFDQEVTTAESAILLLLYALYVLWMKFNAKIEVFALSAVKNYKNSKGSDNPHPKWKLSKAQKYGQKFFGGLFFQAFIYLVIAFNIIVVVMQISEGEDAPDWYEDAMQFCNIVYVLECLGKLYAFQFIGYFEEAMNIFDGLLVFLIILEWAINSGLSTTAAITRLYKVIRALRGVRMLRLYKAISRPKAQAGSQVTEEDIEAAVAIWDSDNTKAVAVVHGDAFNRVVDTMPIPVKMVGMMGKNQEKIASREKGKVSEMDKVMEQEMTPIGPPAADAPTGESKTDKNNTGGDESSALLPGIVSSDDTPSPNGQRKLPPLVDDPSGDDPKKMPPISASNMEMPTFRSDIWQTLYSSAAPKNEEDSDDEDDDDDGIPDFPFAVPEDSSVSDKIWWICTLPVYAPMYFTTPPVKKPGYTSHACVVISFIMAVVWIALYTYLMVWMASVLGKFAGIPDPVMGLTFLAAGTSLPDTMASVGVALKGNLNAALANANGSNVFDICIGLAIPWFFATLIFQENIHIQSDALGLTVFTLFLMVGVVVICFKVTDWRLTKKISWIFMFLYFLFIIQSLLLEYGFICV